jgi:alkylation response protein AidB-like acyl-CoA dehydrogenase
VDLAFNKEQEMLKTSAREFLTKNCPRDLVMEMAEDEKGYPPELWRNVAELGWLGLGIPEEYGGTGGNFLEVAALLEEMGRVCFPGPFVPTIIGASILVEAAKEEQKREFLPKIVDGDLILCLANIEEDANYDPASIKTAAVREGDGYVINGTKMFVQDANIAQKLIVAAKADAGTTLFVVDADDPGITINKIPTIALDNTCEVIFKDVKVPKENVLGEPGKGWEPIEKMTSIAAIAKSAEMIGGGKVCIDMTADYAKERVQYEKPIGGFQIIQHYMANMNMAYDTIYNYLYRVAWMVDEGMDVSLAASVLKAKTNENYKFITDRAVQIHGGIGTTREYDVALFFRRAKSWEFVSGDTDYHTESVVDSILEGMPEW